MRARSAAGLLHLPVRLHGIQLGRPTDVVFDSGGLRAVGIDVRCGDDVNRFLPLAAAGVAENELVVHSALLLLEEREAAFYKRKGVTLRALLGNAVEQGGRSRGRLRDLVVDERGVVETLVVDADGVRVEVAVDDTVRIVPGEVSAA